MTRFDCTDPGQRATVSRRRSVRLKGGRLVVLPTDTVYGIGADAFDSEPSPRCSSAKGRGRDMPVPVLVGSWHTIDGLVTRCRTAHASSSGVLAGRAAVLVVRQAPSLQWDLGDAHGTVMLRMPLHPVAIELLREVGPMAVSSANISGRPAAVTVDDARSSSATSSRCTSTADRRNSRRRRRSSTSPAPIRGAAARPVTAEPSPKVLGVEPASLTDDLPLQLSTVRRWSTRQTGLLALSDRARVCRCVSSPSSA
jgi:tRNA threonylcarbamoyl adenosine modification protein (Sua5/YciO/YrdC/YwlC family)